MSAEPQPITIFKFLGTPVKVQPVVLINLAGLWAGLTWLSGRRKPDRSWLVHLVLGGMAMIAMITADFGHALAHVVSARWAGAPTDEVFISASMPRTLYDNNQVPPRAHIGRSLGGPIFSASSLLISLLLRALAPADSAARELAGWSALGHGLILAGSLAPLPIVDGGVILKWGLVEGGRSEAQAEAIVEQAGLATGAAALGAGAILAGRRRWLPAAGLALGGLVALAAARGKLR